MPNLWRGLALSGGEGKALCPCSDCSHLGSTILHYLQPSQEHYIKWQTRPYVISGKYSILWESLEPYKNNFYHLFSCVDCVLQNYRRGVMDKLFFDSFLTPCLFLPGNVSGIFFNTLFQVALKAKRNKKAQLQQLLNANIPVLSHGHYNCYLKYRWVKAKTLTPAIQVWFHGWRWVRSCKNLQYNNILMTLRCIKTSIRINVILLLIFCSTLASVSHIFQLV